MFEGVPDSEVVTIVTAQNRAAAAADAQRLAAIAELVSRRCHLDDPRDYWACDPWDEAAAEISAAMGVTRRVAAKNMRIAVALRDGLPKIAALYRDGAISSRVVAMITWRTRLVGDPDALSAIDSDLAERVDGFEILSDYRLEQAIDQSVDRFDPAALVRTQNAVRGRDVQFGDEDDTAGTTSMWGRLNAADAALIKQRITQMATAVCPDDPRTKGQRRADALGILGAGGEHLPCQCGNPNCPAAGIEDVRATSVVIHVIAEQATLDAEPDPAMNGDPFGYECDDGGEDGDGGGSDCDDESGDDSDDEARTAAGTPAPPNEPVERVDDAGSDSRTRPAPGLIVGGGIIPAPLLAELIRNGARLQPLRTPSDEAENRYRPSSALADFVRLRDLTCRFPGCNRPAVYTDIDHTVPYPVGPTHPSDLKCLCRHHHLLKTFWYGVVGWTDRQFADGTIVWTSPTGHTYTTRPTSRLFFPHWPSTTHELRMPTTALEFSPDRGAMMPRRRRTRAQDRAQRIQAERALNDAYVAERNRPPPF